MKLKKEYTLLYIISLLALAIVIFSVVILNNKFVPTGATVTQKVSKQTIILDPGHGGFDGGAVAADGTVEKDINLAISLKLEQMLSFIGFDVVMTRETDTAINDDNCTTTRQKKVSDIHNRLNMVENTPGAVLLSIHQNEFSASKYSGTQVFFGPNNEESNRFAGCIQSVVVSLLQPENTRQIKKSTDSIYILYHAEAPAVLVECGFLSNPEEAALLKTDEYQSKMAFAIMCGTVEFFSGTSAEAEE